MLPAPMSFFLEPNSYLLRGEFSFMRREEANLLSLFNQALSKMDRPSPEISKHFRKIKLIIHYGWDILLLSPVFPLCPLSGETI